MGWMFVPLTHPPGDAQADFGEAAVVIAGVPRKARPDGTFPTREELLTINLKVTKQVAVGIEEYCPDATIISIANPLDAIVYRLYQQLNPPKNKLVGMAGAGYAEWVAWFQSPLNASLMVMLVLSVFFHARLGVQVMIEDYVHSDSLKVTALIAVTLAAAAMASACVVSILMLATGS